jgi:hypothetical protein
LQQKHSDSSTSNIILCAYHAWCTAINGNMQAGIRLAYGSATYSFVMQAGHRYVLPYLRWCRDLPCIRAKNSYSIEHRLIDYVPTAFYGAVVVVSPDARAASSSYLS